VDSDGSEDARERADAEARMIGDRHVVFATMLRRQAHMAAGLPCDLVSITA
jgi:hypothetical protein